MELVIIDGQQWHNDEEEEQREKDDLFLAPPAFVYL